MKYHIQRWKGPMSVACFIQLREFTSFVRLISPFLGLPITFIVYVPLKPRSSSYFIENNGTRSVFSSLLYPVNLLRDLAIESIHTTHYMHIDADLFLSSWVDSSYSFSDTIEQSFQSNIEYLRNERDLLVLLYFKVARKDLVANCRNGSISCEAMSSLFVSTHVDGARFP